MYITDISWKEVRLSSYLHPAHRDCEPLVFILTPIQLTTYLCNIKTIFTGHDLHTFQYKLWVGMSYVQIFTHTKIYLHFQITFGMLIGFTSKWSKSMSTIFPDSSINIGGRYSTVREAKPWEANIAERYSSCNPPVNPHKSRMPGKGPGPEESKHPPENLHKHDLSCFLLMSFNHVFPQYQQVGPTSWSYQTSLIFHPHL